LPLVQRSMGYSLYVHRANGREGHLSPVDLAHALTVFNSGRAGERALRAMVTTGANSATRAIAGPDQALRLTRRAHSFFGVRSHLSGPVGELRRWASLSREPNQAASRAGRRTHFLGDP
jgi:hypothetical protein